MNVALLVIVGRDRSARKKTESPGTDCHGRSTLPVLASTIMVPNGTRVPWYTVYSSTYMYELASVRTRVPWYHYMVPYGTMVLEYNAHLCPRCT
jgi:hypothetical protein